MLDLNKLRIGDRLVRAKGAFFSKHHVLYVGFWNEQHYVVENQLGHGVHCITLNQFLREGELDRVEYNSFSQNAQNEVINRVNKKLGTPYNVLSYNCEHFVNEILTGVAESPQIQTAVALSLGALFLAAITSNGNES